MTRILVVEDHPLFREGFAYIAAALRPQWSVAFAEDCERALEMFAATGADIVLVDIGLPGEDGFSFLRKLAAQSPQTPQIIISGREDMAARLHARTCGARAFILKNEEPKQMLEKIDAVLEGSTAHADSISLPILTPRQIEVLLLLAEGHGNKEIRHRLGIAERTVRAHLTEIFRELGAHSRMQALLRARELGLIG